MRTLRSLVPLVAVLGVTVAGLEAGARHRSPPKAKDRALAEAGRRLFFEPVLSRTGHRSCASCHDPSHGFSDPSPFSHDDVGKTLRHSQTVLDSAFNPSAHWDGEFRDIETLVTARIGLPQSTRGGSGYGRTPAALTPGHSTVTTSAGEAPAEETDEAADPAVITPRDPDLARKLAQLGRGQVVLEEHGRYADLMKATFGDASVSRARVARAIAAYCRSVHHTPSAYDRWKDGDVSALSASARRGLDLFKGRAGCASCHTMAPYDKRSAVPAGRRAAFTDLDFHNTGLAWRETHDEEGASALRAERGFSFADPGRARLTGVRTQRRAFKTPTLRDVTRRGPYMHNGSLKTLEDVVRYYAGGGTDDPEQDERMRGFPASDEDVADLVAFLRSLTGATRPGLAADPYRGRASTTRLRFVDADGAPLCGLPVRFLPAGDTLPAEKGAPDGAVDATTDAKGWITFAPRSTTHVRIVLPDEVAPLGGVWVPDTCTKAVVRVPVRGHATLAVLADRGASLPQVLYARHTQALRIEGHEPPRTKFVRTHDLPGTDHRVVRYRGWLRTDVPPLVTLELPNAPDPVTLSARPAHLDLRSSTPKTR